MKLTVCFGDTKVVVPCGSGDISIRDLACNGLKRVRHTLPKLNPNDRVVVHNVTIARDGGILDWDDLVRDVLDDRELVTCHYSIATLAVENTRSGLAPLSSTSSAPPGDASADPLFHHICTPLVVDLCSDSGAGVSAQSGPRSNEASGSVEGVAAITEALPAASLTTNVLTTVTRPTVQGDLCSDGLVVGDGSASASSSSLSLNMSSGSCCVPGQTGWLSTAPSGGTEVTIDAPRTSAPHCSVTTGSVGDNQYKLERCVAYPQNSLPVNGLVNKFADHSPGSPNTTDVRLHRATEQTQCSGTFPKLWQKAFPPTPFELLPAVLSRRRDCLAMNWDSDEDEEEEEDVDFDEAFDSGLHSPSRSKPRTVLEQPISSTVPSLVQSNVPSPCPRVVRNTDLGPTVPNSNGSVHTSEFTSSKSYADSGSTTLPEVWPLPPPPPQFDDTVVITSADTIANTRTEFLPSGAQTANHQDMSSVSVPTPSPTSVSQEGDNKLDRCALSDSLTPLLQNCLLQSSSVCVCSEVSLLTSSITTTTPVPGNARSGTAPSFDRSSATPPVSANIMACDAHVTTAEPNSKAIDLNPSSLDMPLVNSQGATDQSQTFAMTMSPTPMLQPVPVPPIRMNVNRFGSAFACGPPVPTILEVEEEEEEVDVDQDEDEADNADLAERDIVHSTGTTKRSPVKTNQTAPILLESVVHTTQPQAASVPNSSALIKSCAQQQVKQKEAPVEREEEGGEEDYPLLRPDYFVGHDRSEDGDAAARTLETGHLQRPASSDQPRELQEPSSGRQFNFRVAVEEENLPISQHHSLTNRGGMDSPAVLLWLESTQAMTAASGPGSIAGGTTHMASDTASLSTVSNQSPRTLHEQDAQPTTRPNSRESRDEQQTQPGTVLVRLANTKPGENLGIQIKPVFTDRTELIAQGFSVPERARVEAGLEVHHVMPNGRVAREGFLSVGDRILSIDGVSLIGVPFERGRDLFQAALKKPELTLQIQRKSARLSSGQTDEKEQKKSCLPSCRLVVVPDMSDKAKEAEASRTGNKPAPPPPPRRSPNTMLTRIPAGIIPPLIEEFLQEPNRTCIQNAGSLKDALPVLPPKVDTSSRNTSSTFTPALTECLSIQLKKGSNGLGFSLTSRDLTANAVASVNPERVVCVKNILPGGAALLDGRLRSGDRLVQVDGLDVTKLGQANTVALLREKPVNSVVDLLVWRSKEQEASNDRSTGRGKNPATSASRVEVEEQSTKSSVALNCNSTKSTSATSPSHLPPNQLYKLYAIDPAQYSLLQLHISLPQVPPLTLASSAEGLVGASGLGSTNEVTVAHPVTLGVSVTVRPLANQPIAANHPEDTSNNAVFVRTVIEGGPAYLDGRLKIGDRLLTIDGEPLSGITSADALNRLKTVIARDMAENRPHVCLLIARSRTPLAEEPERSTSRTMTRGTGHLPTSTSTKEPSGRTESSSIGLSSTAMVVSADVHPPERTADSSRSKCQPIRSKPQSKQEMKLCHSSADPPAANSTSDRTSTARLMSQTKQANRSRSGDDFPNRRPNGPKKTVQKDSRKEECARSVTQSSTAVRLKQVNNSSEEAANVIHPLAEHRSPLGFEIYNRTSHQTERDQTLPRGSQCMNFASKHSAPIPMVGSTALDRFYRCDSQGTISSTEMPEDEARLSDHNPANAPHESESTTPPTSSPSADMEGSAVLSDPETERYSSLRSRHKRSVVTNGTRTLRSNMRHGPAQQPPCRVIVRQPIIDLSQMVLVPFDADSWSGPVLKPRSSLSSSERAQLVDPQGLTASPDSKNHEAEDILSRNRQLFSKKGGSEARGRCDSTPSSCLSAAQTQTTTVGSRACDSQNKGLVLHYDSDSGASHQSDSWASEAGQSSRLTKKRTVMSKLLGLVKSGTQRRFTHPDITEAILGAQPTKGTPTPIPPHSHANAPPLTAMGDQRIKRNGTDNDWGSSLSTNDRMDTKANQTLTRATETKTVVDPVKIRLTEYCTLNNRPSSTHHVYHLAREPQASIGIPVPKTSSPNLSPAKKQPSRAPNLPSNELNREIRKPRTHTYADLAFTDASELVACEQMYNPSRIPNHPTEEQTGGGKSTVNKLYETDVSSCSTAYESVVEFLTATEGSSSPKQKSSREVYEDAEALYRYLADLKQPTGSEGDNQTLAHALSDQTEPEIRIHPNASK